jgi:hypothetical protein
MMNVNKAVRMDVVSVPFLLLPKSHNRGSAWLLSTQRILLEKFGAASVEMENFFLERNSFFDYYEVQVLVQYHLYQDAKIRFGSEMNEPHQDFLDLSIRRYLV